MKSEILCFLSSCQSQAIRITASKAIGMSCIPSIDNKCILNGVVVNGQKNITPLCAPPPNKKSRKMWKKIPNVITKKIVAALCFFCFHRINPGIRKINPKINVCVMPPCCNKVGTVKPKN